MSVELPDAVGSRSGTVVLSGTEGVASDQTAAWAVQRLREVLAARGIHVGEQEERGDVLQIRVGLAGGPLDDELTSSGIDVPSSEEAFTIQRRDDAMLVVGADGRGLSYGVLELADVAELAPDAMAALRHVPSTSESPATPVRGVLRTFTSDVQDEPWFHDRGFWEQYLTELATHRINRLQLALGMQFNYSHDVDVQDNYLTLAYPFLLDVQGFDVRAGGVTDEERDRNLETLRFISDETKRRGIHFQLGLWNHAYDFPDSDRIRYPISGLTPENHAEYCSAALETLLTSCPSIDGVTFRVHYEGGTHEPGHVFWSTVLAAIPRVGRPIEIDMHSKGVDNRLLDAARSTGSPFMVSAKYWAEHWGLPYHQTAVRKMEAARPPREGLSSVTRNERRFTRYGYGDFLREDRDYDVMFRIWPGTQRLLLWGDPVLAAGIGRLGTIGGSLGVELCEPLSFKGRKTSGTVDGRDPYIDPALQLEGDPTEKYSYTYRLWGRLLYDPDADAASWQRYLQHEFGPAAHHVEAALGAASRVLPLVTTSHGPSASNNFYWPEMYVNMPLVDGPGSPHYAFDTPDPGTLGAASPFDPAIFDTIDAAAAGIVSGQRSGKHTPSEVAGWLDRLANDSERHLAAAVAKSPDAGSPSFRRLAIDVAVLAHLGHFFADKNRAGISYALYRSNQSVWHLGEAVSAYRSARDAYAAIVDLTTGIYQSDLAFGDRVAERGHWSDRLPAIEDDLAALEAEQTTARREHGHGGADLPHVPVGVRPALDYTLPDGFVPGDTLPVHVTVAGGADVQIDLHYRHLNQGEQWVTTTMDGGAGSHSAHVPATYTDSPYPMALYFTVRVPDGDAWIVPGLHASLADQPYHVLRQQRAQSADGAAQATASK